MCECSLPLLTLADRYGECDNVSVMSGHTGAVVQLCFNAEGDTIYTASTDKTVGVWDVVTGERIKRMKGHTSFVNSVASARSGKPLVVSGGDDCQVKVWDRRKRQPLASLNSTYQVTAVCFNEDASQVDVGLPFSSSLPSSRSSRLASIIRSRSGTCGRTQW
jgi:Prp8 binding protein